MGPPGPLYGLSGTKTAAVDVVAMLAVLAKRDSCGYIWYGCDGPDGPWYGLSGLTCGTSVAPLGDRAGVGLKFDAAVELRLKSVPMPPSYRRSKVSIARGLVVLEGRGGGVLLRLGPAYWEAPEGIRL